MEEFIGGEITTKETVVVKKQDTHNTGEVAVLKEDGWQNIFTGAGFKSRDKFENSQFYLAQTLTDEELTDLYRGDGLAKKIIDTPAKDMTRQGFYIEGDTNNDVPKYLNKLKLQQSLKDALRWSRLYGGALMVMGIDDGQVAANNEDGRKILEKPLKEGSIKKVGFFTVYDRRQITWMATDIDQDPTSSNYGKPLRYRITPINANPTFLPFYVHHSRCLRFVGEDLPQRESLQRYGWGDSVLQSAYIRLRGFASALLSTESILDEFVIGVLTIDDLGGLIANGRESEITKRLNQIDMSKHILNTMLVDKEEDYTRISATVNGIKDILEFLKDCLSAVSGIPQVKLFGEQSQGIGSQASGNIRMYYDDISDAQNEDLRHQLERIVTLVVGSEDFKKIVTIPTNWQLKFRSLWQQTEKELAETRQLIAKADELYLKNGVLTPEEVAESRFGGESYSAETRLTEEGNKKRKEGIVPVTSAVKEPEDGSEDDDKEEKEEKNGSKSADSTSKS